MSELHSWLSIIASPHLSETSCLIADVQMPTMPYHALTRSPLTPAVSVLIEGL